MSHSRKLHSHKQANILKDLRTCSGDDYPTVELTCSNYCKYVHTGYFCVPLNLNLIIIVHCLE